MFYKDIEVIKYAKARPCELKRWVWNGVKPAYRQVDNPKATKCARCYKGIASRPPEAPARQFAMTN